MEAFCSIPSFVYSVFSFQNNSVNISVVFRCDINIFKKCSTAQISLTEKKIILLFVSTACGNMLMAEV